MKKEDDKPVTHCKAAIEDAITHLPLVKIRSGYGCDKVKMPCGVKCPFYIVPPKTVRDINRTLKEEKNAP